MRFIVFGAGAIGGVIGARLLESGYDVTLVARGDHLEAIQRDGLRLHDVDGDRRLRIPAVKELEPATARLPETVVILAVKSQHSAQAIEMLRPVAPPDTPIVCAQNGIANERHALRYFSNVYGAQVLLPATHAEPGVVEAHNAPVPGLIDVGRYPVGSDDYAERLAAALRAAGFDSATQDDIMSWKREKLIVNLGTAVEAICGKGAATGPLAEIARAEGHAVFHATGLHLPSPEAAAKRLPIATHAVIPRAGGSTWQSLQRQVGGVETDYINGEIVLLGRLHNVPTPANELICRHAARLAADKLPPGSIPERDLLNELVLSTDPQRRT
jgi:2-dehydropantoate 2-reductase